MDTLGMAQVMEHAEYNGRQVWHYMIDTQLSAIHVVQYEQPGKELEDSYMGWSNQKAEQAFSRTLKKLISGKI